MRETRDAGYALDAWKHGQRKRRIAGAADRIADGTLAVGGALIVNATTSLNLGLPTGRLGITLGAGLLATGATWMSQARTRAAQRRRPALAPVRAVQPQRLPARLEHAA